MFQLICSCIMCVAMTVAATFMAGAYWYTRHRNDDQPEPRWLRIVTWIARAK